MATRSKSSSASTKKKSSAAARKDPSGGLTAAGRAHFKKTEGANLKPGVKKSDADMSPDEMKRKGSFLRRHFATLRGPLVGDDGKPTRLALQAHAWGEPVPKTEAAAKKLADKGTKLLERYKAAGEKSENGKAKSDSGKGKAAGSKKSATAKKKSSAKSA